MEKFESQQYRDNLAEEIKSEPDKEKRKEILTEKQETEEYQMAQKEKHSDTIEKIRPHEKEFVRLAEFEDIPSISNLIQAYLVKNIPKEKRGRGFLTYNPSQEELKEIINELGIVIEKEGETLKGYLMVMTSERAAKTELFPELLDALGDITYDGKKLSEYNFCVLAQIATDERFRAGVVFKKLHAFTHSWLSQLYEIGVGEIDDRNQRSLAVHTKVAKMTDAGTYTSHDDKKWHVVLFDYRKLKKQNNQEDMFNQLKKWFKLS